MTTNRKAIDWLQILQCPHCNGPLADEIASLRCRGCGTQFPITDGRPVFTSVPVTIAPSRRKERGSNAGTVWRRANWRFFAHRAAQVAPSALVVDVGSGRGDLESLLGRAGYVAVDVFPYPEVDLVCDLTVCCPFRPGSVDVVVLSNILEHVPDAPRLIRTVARMLKTDGQLLIAVPFLIKLHQTPHDFARYTQFALERMLTTAGFEIRALDAVLAPFFLARTAVSNFASSYEGGRLRRQLITGLGWTARLLVRLARRIARPGEPVILDATRRQAINPYPIGYHVEARRLSSTVVQDP